MGRTIKCGAAPALFASLPGGETLDPELIRFRCVLRCWGKVAPSSDTPRLGTGTFVRPSRSGAGHGRLLRQRANLGDLPGRHEWKVTLSRKTMQGPGQTTS